MNESDSKIEEALNRMSRPLPPEGMLERIESKAFHAEIVDFPNPGREQWKPLFMAAAALLLMATGVSLGLGYSSSSSTTITTQQESNDTSGQQSSSQLLWAEPWSWQ